MRTMERCACAQWLSVASSASFCARDAHKCFMSLCIGAFHIIIFLHNERLLIAFLIHLICHMVLPHYCAVRLKEMSFNCTVYLYIKILLVFHECILQQYIIFTRFSPTLIHFSFFPNNFLFPLILDFIKLCTHDFSRVNLATGLSSNLVYKIILS